jgi:hypothetical protein
MTNPSLIWLASYPRSGNTYLRTILWQCFGLRSASVYPTDLGQNKALEDYVGHIEHDQQHRITFPEGALKLVKTHEYPRDDGRAIYVLRDGRDACISLWKFYDKQIPLAAVVRGEHRFGTWAAHANAWRPTERPNTLFLRYEAMVGDLPATLKSLSDFVDRPITSPILPDRNTIAGVDGRWVKAKDNARAAFTDDIVAEYARVNGEVAKLYGYDP